MYLPDKGSSAPRSVPGMNLGCGLAGRPLREVSTCTDGVAQNRNDLGQNVFLLATVALLNESCF